MTRFMVFPWKMASEGAKMLAEGLGGKRIRLEGSDYEPRPDDVIVNWGNGHGARFNTLPEGTIYLNPNPNVCILKTKFFERMQGHNIVPPFAFSKDEALRHLQFPIVCRTTTEGADGQGIVIANNADELARAKLYTQLMEKTAEYRLHMGRLPDGTIELIAAQKKRVGASHENGVIWTGQHVYLDWCEPIDLPQPVIDMTKRAMELMPELHFGGFDTILTNSWGARVVEVNSAPMMTPDTTRKYVEFINRYVAMARPPVAEPEPFPEDPSETEDYQAGYAAGRQAMWEILQRCWQENNL